MLLISCFIVRSFHEPLSNEDLNAMSQKKFGDETYKKMRWVLKMYNDWRNFRNSEGHLNKIDCNLEDSTTITTESLVYALCRFLTEVKKLDGTEFPGRTLYDILICVQFLSGR